MSNQGDTKRYCGGCHKSHGYQKACNTPIGKIRKRMKTNRVSSGCRLRKNQYLLNNGETTLVSAKKQKVITSTKPEQCPICLDDKGTHMKLGCNHSVCPECYDGLTKNRHGRRCPMCRAQMFRGLDRIYRCHSRNGMFSYFVGRHNKQMRLDLMTEPELDDELEYVDSDEYYSDQDSDDEYDEVEDNFQLYIASQQLYSWRMYGGDLISKQMIAEANQYHCPSTSETRWLTEIGQKRCIVGTNLILGIVDTFNFLYSVDPPEDPYNTHGLIIGELRRVLGYSTWINAGTDIPRLTIAFLSSGKTI